MNSASTDMYIDCNICGQTDKRTNMKILNGKEVCSTCSSDIANELAKQHASLGITGVPLAFCCSLLGATLAAAVWSGIAISSGYEIGYVAVLVGFLAGQGAILPVAGSRGKTLQMIAVFSALVGLVLAKFIIFDYYVVEDFRASGETGVNYFSPGLIPVFIITVPKMLSPFDLLWLFLAFTTAWRIPAPVKVVQQD